METFSINYSEVVNVATTCIKVALPISLVFGIAEKAVNLFLSMVLGKERIDL